MFGIGVGINQAVHPRRWADCLPQLSESVSNRESVPTGPEYEGRVAPKCQSQVGETVQKGLSMVIDG